jgi:hypothetical protein
VLQQEVNAFKQDKLATSVQLHQGDWSGSNPLQPCMHPFAENQPRNMESSILDQLQQEMEALQKRQEPYLKPLPTQVEATASKA